MARASSAGARDRHSLPGRIQRLLLLAGILGPIIFWIIMITAGMIRPGYDPIRHYGSELEVGSHGWLQRVNFILFGIFEMAFAVGLNRGLSGGRGTGATLTFLASALVGIGGASWMLVGLFPGGTMHYRAARFIFYAWIPAFVILAVRLRSDVRWRAYAPYSVLAAVLSLLLFWVYIWGAPLLGVTPWIGLVQRLLFAVTLAWLELLALRLFALSAS